MTACWTPRASNEEVSGSVLSQLQSQTAGLDALGMKIKGDTATFEASWDAPKEVHRPMLWINELPAVNCSVNGGPVFPVIVDTGSQGCVLEASTAVERKVQIVNPSDIHFTLSGIAGSENALMGLPDLVKIGDWKMSRFPLLVRTRQSQVSMGLPFYNKRFSFNVWGMDPTKRLCSYLTLDYPRREVIFGFSGNYKPVHRLRWRTQLHYYQGLPQLTLHSQGVTWQAIVDTGASSLLELNEDTARRMHVPMIKADATRIGLGGSLGPSQAPCMVARLDRLEGIGPKLANPYAMVVNDYSKVGTGLLQGFRVTFDFASNQFWVEDDRT